MQTDKSLPELTRDFAFQLSDLLREEVRLARVEAVQNVQEFGAGAGKIATGAILAGAAGTLALLALAYALSEIMPLWAGAALAAATGAFAAYIYINAGRKALAGQALSMPRTKAQIAQDVSLIKEHAPS